MRWARRLVIAAAGGALALVLAFHAAVAWWPYPGGVERMPADSTVLCDADDQSIAEFVAADGQWRSTLTEEEISPHLLKAAVAVEDARFFEHGGVDWRAAVAAAWQDLVALRPKRGASTITMQLQRLRQPGPHGLLGKVAQAVRATQVERSLGKRQILVEYLDRAPFGGNLVGAGAASWRYFGRPCRELSLAQAALLAGLPKNPNADRPDRFPARAKARRDLVLGRMVALGMIDARAHAAAVAEPVNAVWRPLPQRQPADVAVQAALPSLTRLAGQNPRGGRFRTTLDRATQQLAAAAANEHLERQGERVSEIAVVVVEVASARCLASVSLSRSGVRELDLTRRPRSTGSVIKPVIYAAAFDAGISSPVALLDDSPALWPGGYAPVNYDLSFRGRMTAAEALAESRNVPALRLLSAIGVERAAAACGSVGLRTLARTPQRYGLSLAIGGAEATPVEVAEAYATLARGGVYRPMRWLQADPTADARTVSAGLSSQACRDTLACLSDAARTAAVCPEAAALGVAWKTGTSSGHRDAWCAAVGPARVVVVWMGNADGAGSRSLVGGEAAAPLALRILAAVDAGVPVAPPPAPVRPTSPPSVDRSLRRALTIVSPVSRSDIVDDPETPSARRRVPLRARLTGDDIPGGELLWFVDGTPVGTAAPGEPAWWQPSTGEHEVRVVGATGLSDRVTIRVRPPSRSD